MAAVSTGISHDGVGQPAPLGGIGGRRTRGRDRPKSCCADQPGMRPVTIVQFPDTGIGILPAVLDGGYSGGDGLVMIAAEVVMAGGDGEQQQCLAEGVELELGIDVVADDVVPAAVAGQVQ